MEGEGEEAIRKVPMAALTNVLAENQPPFSGESHLLVQPVLGG